MARHAKIISQGNTATEHLSVGVLSLCYPLPAVRAVVECDKMDKRVRDLPAALVVNYVIGLSLFPGVAYRSVLRWLIGGLQWLGNHHRFRVAGSEALSRARQRLDTQPMQRLHETLALLMRERSLPGSYFKDLLLVASAGRSRSRSRKPKPSCATAGSPCAARSPNWSSRNSGA